MINKLLKTYIDRDKYKRKIYKVEIKTLNYYVNQWTENILKDDRRLLYSYDDESGLYVGVDNTTNNCWVEEFNSEEACIKWLKEVA